MARILLIEDNEGVARAISDILSDDGHQVEREATVESALVLLECEVFDLEIWDGSLAHNKRDGVEAAIARYTSDRNVMVLSADDTSLKIAKAHGVPHAFKPMAGSLLRDMVEQLLTRVRRGAPAQSQPGL